MTGPLTGDNRFIVSKYFLDIFAGISNAEVVLDPDGVLVPGREERVPFLLADGDHGVDVILLTPFPQIVDFQLEAPSGERITPASVHSVSGANFVSSRGVAYYRVTLPLFVRPKIVRCRQGGGPQFCVLASISVGAT